MGIGDCVFWKGCVEVVTDFYDSIDILLVPSIREPLGLVSLEAAARGVPVIAAAVDGLPEGVLDGKTGICLQPTLKLEEAEEFLPSPGTLPDVVVDTASQTLVQPKVINPVDLADAIERLMNDPQCYGQYSLNGICHARSRADFHSYFNALQNILEYSDANNTEGEVDPSTDSL